MLRKILFVLFSFFFILPVCAQYPGSNINIRPGSIMGWDNNIKDWRPVSVSSQGAVLMLGEIDSATISAELFPHSQAQTLTFNLPANTSVPIPALSGRRSITISVNTKGAEIWLATGHNAAIGSDSHRFLVSIEAPYGDNIPIYVISSTSAQICVTQSK